MWAQAGKAASTRAGGAKAVQLLATGGSLTALISILARMVLVPVFWSSEMRVHFGCFKPSVLWSLGTRVQEKWLYRTHMHHGSWMPQRRQVVPPEVSEELKMGKKEVT